MPKQIIIAEQHRIAAVFSEDQIQELVVATGSHQVGDIYLGIVENVLPGIDAAFVNIGDAERNGFIHVSDLGPVRLRRSSGSITELLAPQQKVLVQVMKEPTGNKGPRLTGKVSLPGRYLVLIPHGRGVNLSRRIEKESERHRLRALAILIKPSGMGLLVRTEAEGVAEEAIMEDLEALQSQWEEIGQEAKTKRPPALLNRDDDFIQRVLRDAYTAEVNRIVVDSHAGTKRIKQHLSAWSGGKSPKGVTVDHHRDRSPILEFFRVNASIREALKPRVDLPSGGYIIIEPTEALTVIDVNSGSFTRSATARETVLWTNCEAATEIARQLRLRNIGGVIVIDFIDMDSQRDRLQVLEHFSKAIKADKARPQIAQLSELGLVELTRKRQGQNIYELFGRVCPTCSGLGRLVQLPDDPESTGPSNLLPGLVSSVDRVVGTPSTQTQRVPAVRRIRSGSGRVIPAPIINTNGSAAAVDVGIAEAETELEDLSSARAETSSSSRRRRRRRPGESNDEEPRRTSTRLGRGDSARDRLAVELTAPEEDPDLDDVIVTDPLADALEPERSSDRRGGRGNNRTIPTAEVVSVVMTPEEQEVYAWMGLSPLVLSDRPVEHPESATIAIRLPGEPDPALDMADDGMALPTDNLRLRGGDAGVATPTEAPPKPVLAKSRSTPQAETTPEATPTPSESPEAAPARSSRRRRRRSSQRS